MRPTHSHLWLLALAFIACDAEPLPPELVRLDATHRFVGPRGLLLAPDDSAPSAHLIFDDGSAAGIDLGILAPETRVDPIALGLRHGDPLTVHGRVHHRNGPSLTFLVDLEGPTLTSQTPVNATLDALDHLRLTFDDPAGLARLDPTLTFAGRPLAPSSYSVDQPPSSASLDIHLASLPDGELTLSLVPTDLLGNIGPPLTLRYLIDQTPPRLEIQSPPSETILGDTFDLELISDPDLALLEIAMTDAAGLVHRFVTPFETTPTASHAHLQIETAPFAEGPMTLLILATDHLGHRSEATRSILVDRQPPRLVSLSPPPLAFVRPPFSVNLEAADDVAGLAYLHVPGAAPIPFGSPRATIELDIVPSGPLLLEDRVGRITPIDPQWRLDLAPPEVRLTPSPSETPLASLEALEITLDDPGCAPDLDATLASLSLSLDGTPQPSSPSLSNPIRLALPAVSGLWQLELTPVDRCGNVGPRTNARYLLDLEPPSLELSPLPAFIHGPFTPIFEASEALAALDYRVPSDLTSTFTPLDSKVAIPDMHPDGLFTLELRARDLAGHLAYAQAITTLDRTAPELFVAAPPWVGPSTHLSISVLDPTSGVEHFLVFDDGAEPLDAFATDAPIASVSRDLAIADALIGLAPDTKTLPLHIRAEDFATNATALDVDLRLDLRPPSASSPTTPGVGVSLPEVQFELSDFESGPSPENSLLEATRDGLEVSCVSLPSTTTLAIRCPDLPGRWQLRLTPADDAGNRGIPAVFRYDVDRAPPELRFVGASAEGWAGLEQAPIDLFVADDTAVTEVRLTLVDAAGTAIEQRLTSPPWQTVFDLRPLSDGELTITAVATDLARRETKISKTLAIDNQPPSLEVRPPQVVGRYFDLSVNSSDAGAGLDRVEVRLAGALLALLELDGASDSSTPIPIALPASFPDGPFELEVTAVDLLGRLSTTTASLDHDGLPPSLDLRAPSVVTPNNSIELHFTDKSGVDLEAVQKTLAVRLGPNEAPYTTDAPSDDTLRLFPGPALSGMLTLVVTAIDTFGNASETHIELVRVDTAAPTFVRLSPANGSTSQSPVTPIIVTFSEAIARPRDSDIILEGFDREETRSIPFTMTSNAQALTLTPLVPLRSSETVSVRLSGSITDLASNPLIPPAVAPSFTVRAFTFLDVAPLLGLVTQAGGTSEPGENHGPGGLFTDLDNDHFPDLILPAREYRNLNIYRNVGASNIVGRTLQPTRLGPPALRGGTGALAADIDNDGDRDVYLTYWSAPNVLYRNLLSETGRFEFEDATADTIAPGPNEFGLATSTDGTEPLDLSMTAAFADVDRDGLLDLYVGHHNGFWNTPQSGLLPGQRDTLYQQLSDGTFRDVTMAAQVTGWQDKDGNSITSYQRYSSTNAVIFTDFDDDLWPDLIVTNKTRHPNDHDMLYRNLGIDERGVWRGFHVINWELDPFWGDMNTLPMGIDVSDLDNDGDLDFYISDWAVLGTVPGPNDIWLNRFAETGRIGFERLPQATGVYSWGVQLQDFDNDGRVDIHVATNVNEYDLLYMQRPSPSDFGFDFIDDAAAANIRQRRNSRGSMTADIDRDGQVDLVVINLDDAPRVYWNRSDLTHHRPAHWLTLALVGDHDGPGPFRSTRDAIGARVLVHADTDGDGVLETLGRQVVSGSSCAGSTSSLEVEVGLGKATSVDLEIRWPSGRVTTLPDVLADQYLVIEE